MSVACDALDALPPWEAIPYFQQVNEKIVAINPAAGGILVRADVMRVALVMSVSGAGTVFASMGGGANTGFALAANVPPIVLRFSETGPLCQQTWLANNLGGAPVLVTVYDITLYRWPNANGAGRRRKRGRNSVAK